jgi:hypothetical protein
MNRLVFLEAHLRTADFLPVVADGRIIDLQQDARIGDSLVNRRHLL